MEITEILGRLRDDIYHVAKVVNEFGSISQGLAASTEQIANFSQRLIALSQNLADISKNLL